MSQTGAQTASNRSARIGDLLVAGGFVLPSEIKAASEEQATSHKPIGDILVSHGELDSQERDVVLRVQETLQHHPEEGFRLDAEARNEAHVRLGDLLVEHGDIDARELEEALELQRQSRRPLGEVLVAQGSVRQSQIDRAVGMQRRLLAAVFSAGMAISGMGKAHAQEANVQVAMAAMKAAPTVTVQAEADPDTDFVSVSGSERATLADLLPKPDIAGLRSSGNEVLDSAAVKLKGFAQDVSGLFDRVEFSGMESHFGAMDANTARDRSEYEVTNDAYVGLKFKVNFASRSGEKGEREVNLNFLPDDF